MQAADPGEAAQPRRLGVRHHDAFREERKMRGTTRTTILAALCLAALSAGWSAGADEPKAEMTLDTLSAAATSAGEIGDKATDERLRTLRVNVGPMPVPVSASNIEYDSAEG